MAGTTERREAEARISTANSSKPFHRSSLAMPSVTPRNQQMASASATPPQPRPVQQQQSASQLQQQQQARPSLSVPELGQRQSQHLNRQVARVGSPKGIPRGRPRCTPRCTPSSRVRPAPSRQDSDGRSDLLAAIQSCGQELKHVSPPPTRRPVLTPKAARSTTAAQSSSVGCRSVLAREALSVPAAEQVRGMYILPSPSPGTAAEVQASPQSFGEIAVDVSQGAATGLTDSAAAPGMGVYAPPAEVAARTTAPAPAGHLPAFSAVNASGSQQYASALSPPAPPTPTGMDLEALEAFQAPALGGGNDAAAASRATAVQAQQEHLYGRVESRPVQTHGRATAGYRRLPYEVENRAALIYNSKMRNCPDSWGAFAKGARVVIPGPERGRGFAVGGAVERQALIKRNASPYRTDVSARLASCTSHPHLSLPSNPACIQCPPFSTHTLSSTPPQPTPSPTPIPPPHLHPIPSQTHHAKLKIAITASATLRVHTHTHYTCCRSHVTQALTPHL